MYRRKHLSSCISCEVVEEGAIDYRVENFKEHPCPFCVYRVEPQDLWWSGGEVFRPWFVPNSVRDFLGMEFLCRTCLSAINWKLTRGLKMCWATASDDVVQLAILMVTATALKHAVQANSPKAIEARRQADYELASLQKKWSEEAPVEMVVDIPIRLRVRPRTN